MCYLNYKDPSLGLSPEGVSINFKKTSMDSSASARRGSEISISEDSARTAAITSSSARKRGVWDLGEVDPLVGLGEDSWISPMSMSSWSWSLEVDLRNQIMKRGLSEEGEPVSCNTWGLRRPTSLQYPEWGWSFQPVWNMWPPWPCTWRGFLLDQAWSQDEPSWLDPLPRDLIWPWWGSQLEHSPPS